MTAAGASARGARADRRIVGGSVRIVDNLRTGDTLVLSGRQRSGAKRPGRHGFTTP